MPKGGKREGAGRKPKSTSGTGETVSFYADPECVGLLGSLMANGGTKGDVICEALRLLARERGIATAPVS